MPKSQVIIRYIGDQSQHEYKTDIVIFHQGTKECIFVSTAFIETIYGSWASTRLDDEYEEFDTDNGGNCIAHVEAVQLAPLDEIVIGALDASSFQSSQQGNPWKIHQVWS